MVLGCESVPDYTKWHDLGPDMGIRSLSAVLMIGTS